MKEYKAHKEHWMILLAQWKQKHNHDSGEFELPLSQEIIGVS